MDFADQIIVRDKMDRAAKLARTYLRKAESYMYPYRGAKGGEIVEPLPVSYHYWDLVEQALETTLAIIEKLPDDFFESSQIENIFGLDFGVDLSSKHNSSDEPLERAQKIVAAIERRRGDAKRNRRIALLENTEGRTEAEAEAFRAGAERMRANG